jgi:2-polyprenyl-6-methoxyphenol hydroxylase-like FAD-dependent oxidoreductase
MKKIIIIGGGIGGLCTAIALQQYGFEVKVYEKMGTLGEVGAGLTLWSNAIKVLRKLCGGCGHQRGVEVEAFADSRKYRRDVV